MMEDLIKAFTTYAGPDADAQRKQYQRMLDLTRTAANACTGLYGKHSEERDLFIELHLAELKALAYSNERNGLKANYQRFECATKQCRKKQCCSTQHRKNVMAAETALLESVHRLETESWLGKLRRCDLLLIGVTIALLLGLWLDIVKLIDWLPLSIENVLPDVLKAQGWFIPVLAWVFLLLLARMKWCSRDKAKNHYSDSNKTENCPSVDGDSSA